MKIIPTEALILGYANGLFPMADSREAKEVRWFTASKRGVIPMDKFHISKNVRRIIRQGKFEVKVNTRFRDVVALCADRKSTWINDLIINSFDIMNQNGHAHSVEIYLDDVLVGGLYGASLGAAFFGESMFKTEPEADKVALYYCHKIMQDNGFTLWDTQYYTDHLSRFGCIEIDEEEYMHQLSEALKFDAEFKL